MINQFNQNNLLQENKLSHQLINPLEVVCILHILECKMVKKFWKWSHVVQKYFLPSFYQPYKTLLNLRFL